MTKLSDHRSQSLQFYATAPYECSYLPHTWARSQVVAPEYLIDETIYSELVRAGFRRSGKFTYRPYCDTCKACTPLRIPVNQFTANRSQRRTWRAHNDLSITEHPLTFNEEHFRLYKRYLQIRHPEGGMDGDNAQQYTDFLLQSNVNTRLFQFHRGQTLVMVSVVDVLNDGLSAVYAFFDPDDTHSSYGTFNILWQIALTQQLGLDFVYLGYWIESCRKMEYKTRFHNYQLLTNNTWSDGDSQHDC